MVTLLHPSRGRAQKALFTQQLWRERAGVDVEYILSLDASDPQLSLYLEYFDDAIILVGDNDSVVEATNKAAKESSGDILVYMSDDFDCPVNWAKNIVELGYEGQWVIRVDDCLQKLSAPLITMPIMSRALYNRLGYFWHPAYKSMYVDNDLYQTCKRLGVIKAHHEMKFQHNHYTYQRSDQDDTYRRTEAFYEQGKKIYEQRKRKQFEV